MELTTAFAQKLLGIQPAVVETTLRDFLKRYRSFPP
jgi:hypothetical protein